MKTNHTKKFKAAVEEAERAASWQLNNEANTKYFRNGMSTMPMMRIQEVYMQHLKLVPGWKVPRGCKVIYYYLNSCECNRGTNHCVIKHRG
jgi:hypothetical protein